MTRQNLGHITAEWTKYGLTIRQGFDVVTLSDDEQTRLVDVIMSRQRADRLAATPSHARWQDCLLVQADTAPHRDTGTRTCESATDETSHPIRGA